MEKKFKLGLVLGRFQHLHNGHREIIEISRKLCQKTLILIGSCQESGTLRNPFTFETRKKAIGRIYQEDDILIGGLRDLTKENNIQCFIKKADVVAKAEKDKNGVEEAGREVRYNFFEEVLKNKIGRAHV